MRQIHNGMHSIILFELKKCPLFTEILWKKRRNSPFGDKSQGLGWERRFVTCFCIVSSFYHVHFSSHKISTFWKYVVEP